MTTPSEKIVALCEKHGFNLRIETPLTRPLPPSATPSRVIQFDRNKHPGVSFQLCGTNEQIYQKFLAVLQAMGWEPPTPTGISADQIQPGPDWYEVVDAADHKTLEVGDSVQMARAPVGAWDLLYRSDGTLHNLQKADGNYVTLISKPLPTLDAPTPTLIQSNINDSAKVRLTDYGRDILRQRQDSRHSFERVDAQGYTRFQLWELMNIFGSHIYNGHIRQCFDANIVLLDSPQP
jgi:hypothetical protein